ncbi:MAG TPA: response regulator transcription factor [Chloroflexota bacterium]|nr:response regulator transcription factor [Chloroflexota bacterium]
MESERRARRFSGGEPPEEFEALTHREMDVLQQLAAGETNRRIGLLLYLSPKTVEYHTRHIFQKLRVSNRTQAVLRAERLGLIVALNGGNGAPGGSPRGAHPTSFTG